MTTERIAKRLVELCNSGRPEAAVDELYAADIVSIEAQGTDEVPARVQGLDAIAQKSAWWFANHEVHAMTAQGPFIGNAEDQFAVKFDIDLTPKGGQRTSMTEVAIYTVRGDRISQEQFLYAV